MKLSPLTRLTFFYFLSFLIISCASKKRLHESTEVSLSTEVLKKHGLQKLKINFDVTLMEELPSDGFYNYAEALDLALVSFLSDDSFPESPLAIVPSKMETYKGNVSKPDQHNSRLKELMNRGGSICMPDLEVSDGDCVYAEEGEDVDKNWIFMLKVPLLSKHSFWAIVPKDGKEKVYNYGFE